MPVPLWCEIPWVAVQELGHRSHEAAFDDEHQMAFVTHVEPGEALDRHAVQHDAARCTINVCSSCWYWSTVAGLRCSRQNSARCRFSGKNCGR